MKLLCISVGNRFHVTKFDCFIADVIEEWLHGNGIYSWNSFDQFIAHRYIEGCSTTKLNWNIMCVWILLLYSQSKSDLFAQFHVHFSKCILCELHTIILMSSIWWYSSFYFRRTKNSQYESTEYSLVMVTFYTWPFPTKTEHFN